MRLRLDEISRDAVLLDALAQGRATDDPTVALLAQLRHDHPAQLARRRHRQVHLLTAFVAATLLSSGIGAAAAATTSHPGDLLYPVHRVVLGRTADDPTRTRQLLDQAQIAVASAPLDVTTRTRALSLVAEAQRRLPALKVRDAMPLAHRARALRARALHARALHARADLVIPVIQRTKPHHHPAMHRRVIR